MLQIVKYSKLFILLTLTIILITECGEEGSGCTAEEQVEVTYVANRSEAIPQGAVKMSPDTDNFPPVLNPDYSDVWENPVPMSNPINTAGVEDSPFITPDGNTFFLFFSPDINIPPTQQVSDGATGIWWSKKVNGEWTEPTRIILNDDIAGDGCAFVQGDIMWFCSARTGGYRDIDIYTADYDGEKWTNWQNAGEKLNQQYEIGELHISSDGNTMYFGSERTGGQGGYDLWKSEKINGEWSYPENLGAPVNSNVNENQPFITSDGNELWFTRPDPTYGVASIYRSTKTANEQWGEPVLIISKLAGEPTLDDAGNIYFTHLFYTADGLGRIEADIYVAYKK